MTHDQYCEIMNKYIDKYVKYDMCTLVAVKMCIIAYVYMFGNYEEDVKGW